MCPYDLRFKFKDYLERLQVIKTFNARFRKWTTGHVPCPYDLPVPQRWRDEPPPAKRRKSSAVSVSVSASTTYASARSKKRRVFDEETETWVEVSILMYVCICPDVFCICPG